MFVGYAQSHDGDELMGHFWKNFEKSGLPIQFVEKMILRYC